MPLPPYNRPKELRDHAGLVEGTTKLLHIGKMRVRANNCKEYLASKQIDDRQVHAMMRAHSNESRNEWVARSIDELTNLFQDDMEMADEVALVHVVEFEVEKLSNNVRRQVQVQKDGGLLKSRKTEVLKGELTKLRNHLVEHLVVLGGVDRCDAAMAVDFAVDTLKFRCGIVPPSGLTRP